MSRFRELRALAYRKLMHILLSILLIIPYIVDLEIYGISAVEYYVILTVIASLVYSAQVKRPIITVVLMDTVSNARKAILQQLSKVPDLPVPLESLNDGLTRLEQSFREIMSDIERDYERRSGYLGILMGMVGILTSQIVAGNHALYGLLSLMIYDTVSAIAGTLLGHVKLPYSNATMEGLLVGVGALALILFLITNNPVAAIAISIIAALAEAYGIEDNLTIPITVSLASTVLGLPTV